MTAAARRDSAQPPAPDVLGDLIELVATAAGGAWRIGRALARRPLACGHVLAGVVLWRTVGWQPVVALAGAEILAILVWRVAFPDVFARRVSGRVRGGRRIRRYRRDWAQTMTACGLSVAGRVPRLRRVCAGVVVDRLAVDLAAGQTAADVDRACEALAAAFAAAWCRVRAVSTSRLELLIGFADPLVEVVPALPVPETVDVDRVPVGVTVDGNRWLLRLRGTHLLIAGVSGSGKASVLWSLLAGVAPAVRDGLVQVWAVDPKGGMEFGYGRPLFARFAADDTAGMVALLEDAVAVLDVRARQLAGITRLHEPSVQEPLIVVVVDELASLTAYCPDRKLRDRASAALSLLLSKGRAVGVTVVAAVQDPSKQVVDMRQLFTTRVALRADTASQVDMVLGDGMCALGAAAHRIPESTPGVGYVKADGVREPVRVRAAWVSDEQVHALAAHYAPAATAGELS